MDGSKQSVSSRLSTSLFGKFARAPPRPPPKDNWYIQNQFASKSSVSLAPSTATSVSYNTLQQSPYGTVFAQDREHANDSLETLQVPHAPPLAIRSHSDLSTLSIPRTMSPVSTHTTTATLSAADAQMQQQGGGFRRGFVSKLSNSLGRRTTIKAGQTQARRQGPISFFSRSNSSQATFASTTNGRDSDDVGVYESPDGDEGVSRPWNVKHDLHVDEDLGNLPPEWMDKLRQSGLRDDDIISVTSRRAHRTTYLKNHPDVSPDSVHSRTGSPFSPATTISYSQSTASASSSSASPVDDRGASPVSSQNHNHSFANGVLASGTNASASGVPVNGTLPASSLPTRSTSLRRPMGSMTGPRMASLRKASAPSSNRSSHSYSDSTGRTPSLSNSSSNHSSGATADDNFSLAEERETIDADDRELYDDPNTATAAHFTIPETSTSAEASLRDNGGGGGHGELGVGDSRGRDVLPRADEEPVDLPHASTNPNLRSQSPRVPNYNDCSPSAPSGNLLRNGLPVVLPLRMNTPSMVGTFRVMNAGPPSPPPAYDLPPAGSPLERYAHGHEDEKSGSPSTTSARTDSRRSEETLTPEVLMRGTINARNEDGELETTGNEDEEEQPESLPRTSALPPRLSFHGDDLGLGNWSASLFSSLGTPDLGLNFSTFSTSSTSTLPAEPSPPSPAPLSQPEEKASSNSPSSSPKKQVTISPLVLVNKGMAIPNVVIETDGNYSPQEDEVDHGEGSGEGSANNSTGMSSTPLFNEVLSLIKSTPTSEGSSASYTNSLLSSSRADAGARKIESPPFTSTYPYLPDPPARPSPPPSASLRSPAPSYKPSHSPKLSPSASPLPSPAPSSSDSHSHASSSAQNHNYEFLNTSYDSERGSTISSDADGLSSAREDRWSRSTTMTVATVRDVKEATIVHGQKTSVGLANAFTVPAPSRQNSRPQLQASVPNSGCDLSPASARDISAERKDGTGSRRASFASTDSAHSPEPSADDFPLPPPSPQSPVTIHTQRIAGAQPSPMSATFSMHSRTSIAYMQLNPGLSPSSPAPPSARSMAFASSPMSATRIARGKPLPSSPVRSLSHSSSGSNNSSSSSSSLMRRDGPTTGSATSCEDETPEPGLPAIPPAPPMHDAETKKDAKALRYNNIRVLSPTGTFTSGTSSEDWLVGDGADMVLDLEPIGLVVPPLLSQQAANGTRLSRGSDGASAVIDWFVDSPSPLQMQSPALRDSMMVLCSSPKSQAAKANGVQDTKESPTSPRRPAIQTEGIRSPSLSAVGAMIHQQQNFLSPASANTARSGNSSNSTSSSSPSTAASSPLARYRGWVSEVVAPLEEFIDHEVEPRTLFAHLTEIAEGESGSVFSATLVTLPHSRTSTSRSRTPPPPSYALSFSSRRDSRKIGSTVAIKNVALLPGGSPKLEDLRKELMLMGRVRHENILSMDALYVDLVEDSLWIEMELMERSLADVLALSEAGLQVDESAIARFSSDVLDALAYLEDQGIVHRDLRSDNLLVNSSGLLKIADFSHALLVDAAYPTYTDPAGVIYWQAPEMRVGSYNALKVDVWSLGATAWEMAECVPPFMDMDVTDPRDLPKRWPPLTETESWSSAFVQFLELCSHPELQRPGPVELSKTAFILSACPRAHVIDILSRCRTLEERMHHSSTSTSSEDSDGTVS